MKKLILKDENFITSLKYIIVGVGNTILGLILYFTFIYLGINYVLSLFISYIIGVTYSFICNKYWTFKSSDSIKKELPKFISVYVITFLLNSGILILFVEKFMLDKRIAQVFAMFIVTIISYLGHKLWSFRK